MNRWKKGIVLSLVCLLTACMPPAATLDRRTDGDWVAERSTSWFQEQDENGQWVWQEKISYTTYFKGAAVSREAYNGTSGKPMLSDWLRPPPEMAGVMAGRTAPVPYFQSLVSKDLQRNEALWPSVGREGNSQKERCGSSFSCRTLDEQISLDKNRLDLMQREQRNMSKWPRPEASQISQAVLPASEGRRSAANLESVSPALPAIQQPTITPQPGTYPGGTAPGYHVP